MADSYKVLYISGLTKFAGCSGRIIKLYSQLIYVELPLQTKRLRSTNQLNGYLITGWIFGFMLVSGVNFVVHMKSLKHSTHNNLLYI